MAAHKCFPYRFGGRLSAPAYMGADACFSSGTPVMGVSNLKFLDVSKNDFPRERDSDFGIRFLQPPGFGGSHQTPQTEFLDFAINHRKPQMKKSSIKATPTQVRQMPRWAAIAKGLTVLRPINSQIVQG